tara:strand:+ start:467 stop:676 length:210 start_codon:yes stop_codon:yes gene_type:complete
MYNLFTKNYVSGRARWGISGALLPATRYSRIDASARLLPTFSRKISGVDNLDCCNGCWTNPVRPGKEQR